MARKCKPQRAANKQSYYGVAGSKKPEFCRGHARRGIVDVCSKRYGHRSYTKLPSVWSATTKASFCAEHAHGEGMRGWRVSLKLDRVAATRAARNPRHTVWLVARRPNSAPHTPTRECIRNERCGHPTCNKQQQSYGVVSRARRPSSVRITPQGDGGHPPQEMRPPELQQAAFIRCCRW